MLLRCLLCARLRHKALFSPLPPFFADWPDGVYISRLSVCQHKSITVLCSYLNHTHSKPSCHRVHTRKRPFYRVIVVIPDYSSGHVKWINQYSLLDCCHYRFMRNTINTPRFWSVAYSNLFKTCIHSYRSFSAYSYPTCPYVTIMSVLFIHHP